jgi:hypothetical protein
MRRHNRPRRCGRLLGAFRDCLQHVTGLGDVRQVNLGLEAFRSAGGDTRHVPGARLVLLEVLLYAFRFVLFNGTGVRFLFGYTDLGKNVEDLSALDL